MNSDCSHFPPVKGKPLSPFISKLKALLNDERFHRAIKWCENGSAIVISDGETFKKIVLDQNEEMKMFKTRNFTSFVRQLNLYGFKKVPVNGKGDPAKNMKFEHQSFRRESPELMHLVKRTCNSRKKQKSERSFNSRKRASKRVASFTVKTSNNTKRRKVFSDECVGPDGDDSETFSASSSEYSSAPSSPSRAETFLNRSNSSSFEQSSGLNSLDKAAAEEYMYQKLQEEQMAVQLLLSLKNTLPRPVAPNCEEFHRNASSNQVPTVTNYTQAPCPYYFSPLPSTPTYYTTYY